MLDAAAAMTRLPRATSCRITSTTAVVLPVPARRAVLGGRASRARFEMAVRGLGRSSKQTIPSLAIRILWVQNHSPLTRSESAWSGHAGGLVSPTKETEPPIVSDGLAATAEKQPRLSAAHRVARG